MTDAPESVKLSIREFVVSATSITDLGDDDDLFESGIVNSLFAVQLIAFAEKSFGIEVISEDLDIRNFRSISAAATFVAGKQR
jgi:methoxymalonate biosynthesis acyl carrier protein